MDTQAKNKLFSGIISDILDEMGFKDLVFPPDFKPNFKEAKIFGRARTILLGELKEGDNPDGIYKALELMETVNPNEVIIVGNGSEQYAFWGELMSTLAIIKGVEGVIIDGFSRDYPKVIEMNFPVFSKGNYCKDIKGRGTLRGLDKRIEISNMVIEKGDLIFADLDGIVKIPKSIEKKFIDKVLKQIDVEQKIIESIKKGTSALELVKKFGTF